MNWAKVAKVAYKVMQYLKLAVWVGSTVEEAVKKEGKPKL
jgi:hypothetical protein